MTPLTTLKISRVILLHKANFICRQYLSNPLSISHYLTGTAMCTGRVHRADMFVNSLSMALQPFLGPSLLFRFVILYTVGRTPRTGDQPVARPLPVHRTAQTQNKRTQTSMPRVGFEPTTAAFERAKTVHNCMAYLIFDV
jgi:hypothetical protein